jgi:hypothetical protein
MAESYADIFKVALIKLLFEWTHPTNHHHHRLMIPRRHRLMMSRVL